MTVISRFDLPAAVVEYQVGDDLTALQIQAAEIGKPTGQDEAHGRPSAVRSLGLDGAVAHLKALVDASVEAVPPCAASGRTASDCAAPSWSAPPQ